MPGRPTLIGLLAGAALFLGLAPVAVDAQPAGRVYQVGLLGSSSGGPLGDVFREALRGLGWVEGRNIHIVGRYAEGQLDRYPGMAAELVGMKVDVIVAPVPAAVEAARNATKTIPIVMVFTPDPVESGLVASLARPGGNITGVVSLSSDLGRKQLELLREMAPGVARIAVLWNPANPWHASGVKHVEAAGRALGVRLQLVAVRDPGEFDAAFAAMAREGAGAVLGLADPLTFHHRARLAELAVKHRLPTMNALADHTEAGGLASYWANSPEMFRRAAGYVDRILRGARPGDLPIEQPTTFELVINMKTARALGLTIPPSLRLRADRVIE